MFSWIVTVLFFSSDNVNLKLDKLRQTDPEIPVKHILKETCGLEHLRFPGFSVFPQDFKIQLQLQNPVDVDN